MTKTNVEAAEITTPRPTTITSTTTTDRKIKSGDPKNNTSQKKYSYSSNWYLSS
jgi:hypothetical protein